MSLFNPPPNSLPFMVGQQMHPAWQDWFTQLARAINSLGGPPATTTSGLDTVPNGTTYVKTLGSHVSGGVAYNFRGVWSAATAYVTGDEVVYGTSYWLALAASTNSAPATGNANWQVIGTYSGFLGAWSAATTYAEGAEITYNGNFWIAVAQNSNSAPTTSNANWQIAGPTSLQYVADGTSRFAVVNAGGMNAVSSVDGNNRALIDFNQTGHLNSNLVQGEGQVFDQAHSVTVVQTQVWADLPYGDYTVTPPGMIVFDVYVSAALIVEITLGISLTGAYVNGYLFRIAASAGAGAIFRSDGAGPSFTELAAGAEVSPGWHTVKIVFATSPDQTFYLYIDGVLNASATDNTYDIAGGAHDVAYSYYGSTADGVVAPAAWLRMPAPPSVSAQANTTLAQSGTTTTINVSAGTFYLGNLTLSFNSGSVNPGAYGKYYIYFDDPTYAGGVETFQATTNPLVITQVTGRFYVGSITTLSGGGGGGGSGGGGGCCLHARQLIELADGSEIHAGDLVAHYHVLSDLCGATPIVKIGKEPWREWFGVTLSNGVGLLVAGDHRFIDPAGNQICARDIRLQQIVRAREGYVFVRKLEAVWSAANKISIEVAEPHTYFVQGILSHNKILC